MTMKTFLLTFFFSLSHLSAQTTVRTLPTHIHGEGQIDLAIDGKNLMMELEIPTESFLGFEHKASTEKEINTVKVVEAKFKHPQETILMLDSNIRCNIGLLNIENVADELHSEYHVEMNLSCDQELGNHEATLVMFQTFKRLKKLKLNILRINGNVEVKEITAQSSDLKFKL